ncbi:MAG: hypothetical protein IMW86_02120 [Hydrogenibacillus sp.]|nr:hypothetical protein [Hydrogenibacillus sp.]
MRKRFVSSIDRPERRPMPAERPADAPTAETKPESPSPGTNTAEQLGAILARIEELHTSHRTLEHMAKTLEQGEFYDLLYNYTRPWRIVYTNLLAGITRGLGITIGATVVFAVVVLVLRHFVTLPLIGAYIANLLDLVDQHRSNIR